MRNGFIDPTYIERVAERTGSLQPREVLEVFEACEAEHLDPRIASNGVAEYRDDALLLKAKARVFKAVCNGVIDDHKKRRRG